MAESHCSADLRYQVCLETNKPPGWEVSQILNIWKGEDLLKEISGSLGDLPLFFIFFVGLTQFTHLNPIQILFWSGLAHIVVGLITNLPLPYQPMKAMGLYAMTYGVSQGEFLAAGFTLGLLILAFNGLGLFEKLYHLCPTVLIRGIQLWLAIKLILKSWEILVLKAHFSDLECWAIFACVFFIFFFFKKIHFFLILSVFAGVLFWFVTDFSNPFSYPSFEFFSFEGHRFLWTQNTFLMVLIQFPLTTANSIFAPCLLVEDLFPNRKISSAGLARSVGWINTLTTLFGGMPACHGAGGLSAQVRFGAQSGKSIIFLGALKVVLAILGGGFFLAFAKNFPAIFLGILFLFPAFDLIEKALGGFYAARFVSAEN